MSEEILKALMELFALIVKQDGGILINEREYVTRFLSKQLNRNDVEAYLALFDSYAGPVMDKTALNDSQAPSVRDTVKILGICKKINKTLNQDQKIVVLIRLYELVNSVHRVTPHRMNIINTVASVFKIFSDEDEAIEQFVRNDDPACLINPEIIVLSPDDEKCIASKKMQTGYQGTTISVLRITSVDLYFIKYISDDQLYLNGLPIKSGNVYTFPRGGSVKSTNGYPIYNSDITSCFHCELNIHKISFTVENLSFSFRADQTVLKDISFSAEQGDLIGILGSSGSGKTTLLNLMTGIQKPCNGTVKVNGLDVFNDNKDLEGVFGFVPQDDLLIEDLTVFENLYFAACHCFSDKTKQELDELVYHTLLILGLHEKKDLKVGTILNKVISGGQRKRLNIALELIREPQIMFLDEPTSGLSSGDSANLMDLLRDFTLKGKLIFTVIHQPSSEIFKMFDKIIILDKGGYMAYYGNPVDSVIYFKTSDSRINSGIGECPSCGNVNPETIFNIIETQIVDEFGKYTEKRKVKPEEWAASFNSKHPFVPPSPVNEKPHQNLHRPGLFDQFRIYLTRDFTGKIANRQYILLTLLEAPVLGFILSVIIRYIPDPDSNIYSFADNENIPIYIFMSLIVALFLGLTISAEEIFHDRKILRRERFLHLSRHSYLLSKVVILILISALQTFLFLIIANQVLGIKGMFFHYWLALFTTAFCANMLGLNISSSLNSAIAIYIVIPILIIPMMVLSGAMFPFDKLNRQVGNVELVPAIAELMPTRWTYEALIVTQFMDNRYSKVIYDREGESYYTLKKKISGANFNKVHRISVLREALKITLSEYATNRNKPSAQYTRFDLLKNELAKLSQVSCLPGIRFPAEPSGFNNVIADSVTMYLDSLDKLFSTISNSANDRIDKFLNLHDLQLKKLENDYYNHRLNEIVTKPYERDKFFIHNNNLIQNTDLIYLDPDKKGPLGFRAHFFSPAKFIFGLKIDTFTFNISLVLLGTVMLYFILYFDLLGKMTRFFEKLNIRKLNI